ncbi:MAG: hypothetical protein ABL958_02335 [Bdellovibrionia bacterium]
MIKYWGIFGIALLIVVYNNCANSIDLRGTTGGNPVSVEVAFAPYGQGSAEHDLKVCLSDVILNETSVAVSSRSLQIRPEGTSVAQFNLSPGEYSSLKLKFSPSCLSAGSVRVVNAQGTFETQDSVTLSFEGRVSADVQALQISLEIQDIINALEAVQQVAEIKSNTESLTESFVSQTSGWRTLPATGTPDGRVRFGSAFSKGKIFVWGGWDGGNFQSDGAVYSPETNQWTPVSTVNAPTVRMNFVSVTTSSEIIVWGGEGIDTAVGARYNIETDVWTPTSANPVGTRLSPQGVWNGSRMFVFGGEDIGGNVLPGGEIYNPTSNTWSVMNPAGAPDARKGFAMHWTGTQVLVWGGLTSGGAVSTGSRYDPSTNTWSAISNVGAPTARFNMSNVWTGSEMIVWGGDGGVTLGDGAIYNPSTDTWRAMSSVNSLGDRHKAGAAWTGKEMMIWGGLNGSSAQDGGARYDPAADTWTTLPNANSPGTRYSSTSLWTGTSFFVWGGTNDSSMLNNGSMFAP